MLVGPLWILAYIDGMRSRLSIITVVIAIFQALVAIGTRASPAEALAATAAYSAVLMVFLQTSN
ncbi:uncharacterized protein DSM5745_05935 [Aspergillus mulundensis]|uniref:DUF6594 domain-containing protein n=1 Tax=Aspergillus mulundensis TaxID=1810919 RepID=A0A3D8RYE4_9EURO|nr:hypothetical protein DSM5745_05935 [Aspergillus mulundensis]RDW79083.1 hypothetical protein DSM5745_05935 [Aspergillus mulundensis]